MTDVTQETAEATAPRITFGDDGSPGSDIAWEWLVHQRWPGWTVDVVTVADPPPGIESLFTHEPLHEHTPDRPRLTTPESGLAGVRHLTTAFDPRIVLAECEGTSVLVIGARGRGLLKAMHIGSTAEWLLQCPTAPTVIARSADPVRRVLIGVDGSGHASAAVSAFAALPWAGDTSVTVLSVHDREDDGAAAAAAAAHLLEEAGLPVETVFVQPDPLSISINVRNVILDEIEARRPDLAVLGTAGRTGLARMRVGSVASAVARHAPCSVLLARDPSAE